MFTVVPTFHWKTEAKKNVDIEPREKPINIDKSDVMLRNKLEELSYS